MGKLFKLTCLTLYGFSVIASLFILSKVIEIRSMCTQEKKRISSLVSRIKELKDENNRLMIEYYEKVRPELSDKGSSKLKTFKEDEVSYIK